MSITRIYHYEGFNKNFIETFKKYRRIPIIFFPSERGGINIARNSKFGDRIDHTLFDLKCYYDKKRRKECRLLKSYIVKRKQKNG